MSELFRLMPSDGALGAWDRAQAYDQETGTPFYYAARFDDSLIRVEFSPTARGGYFRFPFRSGKPIVRLANRRDGEWTANDDGSVSGFEIIRGESRLSPGEMKAFVYGEFSRPVKLKNSPAAGVRA